MCFNYILQVLESLSFYYNNNNSINYSVDVTYTDEGKYNSGIPIISNTNNVNGTMTSIEELYLPGNILDTLDGLCITQIVLSALVVLMYCVLHIPIKVKSGLDVGMTMKEISLDVISDTMLWYYLWYLSFTIAGFAYPRYSNIINTINIIFTHIPN